MTHQGCPERAADLHDVVVFLQPGDSPGPAGEVYLSWQKAVARPVSIKALHGALPEMDPDQIAMWLERCDPCDAGGPRGAAHAMGAGQGAPVSHAAAVLQAVLADRPRDPTLALVFADVALVQTLGWSHVLPLLALGLKRTDLQKSGDELRLACHRAIVAAAVDATREAADLARRAARLNEVAPKLRAKGAEEAVALFLGRDAVAPAALTSLRSDRAARRFCDRLVELSAVRELTGRDSFRLYGV